MAPSADEKPDASAAVIEQYRKELRADPRSRSFVPLAEALSQLGRHQEAVEVCRRGLLSHPDEVAGRLALARALMGLSRRGDAVAALTKVLRQDPSSVDGLCLLGEALVQQGQHERALKALVRASRIKPGDPRIAPLLTIARERLGPRAAALEEAALAEAAAPASSPSPSAMPAARPMTRPLTRPARPGAPAPPAPPERSVPRPGAPASSSRAVTQPVARRPAGLEAGAPVGAKAAAPEAGAGETADMSTAPEAGAAETAERPAASAEAGAAGTAETPAAPAEAGAAGTAASTQAGAAPTAEAPADAQAAPADTDSDLIGFDEDEEDAPTRAIQAPHPLVHLTPDVAAALLVDLPPGPANVGALVGEAPSTATAPEKPRYPGVIGPALLRTVLAPDKPVVMPPVEPAVDEQAWYRTRRRSMRLVWLAAIGVAALVGAVSGGLALLRRAQVDRRFDAATSALASATPEGYRAAATAYREILQREPDNLRAASRLALAQVLLATDYGEGADASIQAQVQRAWFAETQYHRRRPGPCSAEVIAARALEALQQGEWKEAGRLVEEGQAAHPKDAIVLFAAGLTRLSQGNDDGGRTALRAALAAAPELTAPRLWLAHVSLDEGAADAAAVAYSELLASAPEHPGALLGRALAAIDRGLGAEALPELTGRLADAARPDPAAAGTVPGGAAVAPIGLEAWRQLALGQAYQQTGAADKARAALAAAAAGAPPDPRFLVRLMRAELALGRIAEARAALGRALKYRDAKNPQLKVAQAELALAQGFDADAEKLLATMPSSPWRDLALGRARLALGQGEPALEMLRRVRVGRPSDKSLKTYLLFGQVLVAKGRGVDAEMAELRRLAQGDGGGLARYVLGLIHELDHKPAEARTALEAAQRDHAEASRSAVLLAELLGEQRAPGTARETLERSLQQNGEFAPARAALGRLDERLGRLPEARTALGGVLGVWGSPPRGPRGYRPDPDDYVALALADARLGYLAEAEGAIARADAAGAAGPRLVRARALVLAFRGGAARAQRMLAGLKPAVALQIDLGTIHRLAGDAAAAEGAFRAALREDPDQVDALLGLGQLYLLMKDRSTRAIETFERALAAWTKRPYLGTGVRAAIHVGRGRAYLLAGPQRAPEKARAAFEAAIADAPGDPTAHYCLGRHYLDEGDRARAAAELDRALALDPRLADAHFFLAEASATADPARARAAYQEYLSLAPSGDHTQAARQALARLK